MNKKILINFIVFCILISSFNVYATEEIRDESDVEVTTLEISEENENLNFEYNVEQQKELEDAPEIGCKAAYVVEPNTGKIIYEKNAHEKMYPASTTKILTALVVLENCNLTDKATVSQKALSLVPAGYSNAKLVAGEEVTISSLLYALLIPSANEAANVLAEHVSGSVEEFAELCNKRAKELGCENLHFVNPNGIHDDDHYCSAYDLYLIAKECQKYDEFNEIVKTKSFTLPASKLYNKNDRTFTNTNELILPTSKKYYYPYCTGIKTGHTTPAGNCLVSSSSNNDIDLICVVLGGGTDSKGLNERFSDTIKLFDFAYENYSIKQIAKEKQVFSTVNVEKATKETAMLDVVINTDISTIVPNDIDTSNIQKSIKMNEEIVAPIKQNQVLGEITFKADGLNYTTKLYASHDVEKIPYWIYNIIVVVGIVVIFTIILIVLLKFFIKKKKSKKRSKARLR